MDTSNPSNQTPVLAMTSSGSIFSTPLSGLQGINIDGDDNDTGNIYATYPFQGLTFGIFSGEGIGSARVDGSPNMYGLDFYTAFAKRMSITQQGNVGIGTITPSAALEVNGSIKVDGSGIIFADGSALNSAQGIVAANSNGLTVANNLTVAGPQLGSTQGDSSMLLNLQSNNENDNFLKVLQIRNASGASWLSATTRIQESTDVTNQGYIDFNPLNGIFGMAFGSGTTEFMRLINGNVGIGTTNPQATLDVNGNLRISGSGASIAFPDGTVQSTAYTGTCTATGGDYAESVDVAGSRTSYEPGDVMVIGSENGYDVTKSVEPYSTLVAGIYSTKPGYVGRRQTTNPKLAANEIPMAMIGIVPTKVTTENGTIHRGDLLVSSTKPGYAMKGTDRNRMVGAVLGKAMNNLLEGQGVIEVLVTLQ